MRTVHYLEENLFMTCLRWPPSYHLWVGLMNVSSPVFCWDADSPTNKRVCFLSLPCLKMPPERLAAVKLGKWAELEGPTMNRFLSGCFCLLAQPLRREMWNCGRSPCRGRGDPVMSSSAPFQLCGPEQSADPLPAFSGSRMNERLDSDALKGLACF